MNSIKLILVSFVLFFYSANGQIKNNKYNESLSRLVLSNHNLKSKLITMFALNKEGTKILKVLISRRNRFVRISIFQIINKEELNELPSSYFTYKTSTFLCYDGSEIIANNKLDRNFVNKLKSRLESNVINDSRVLQFDLDNEKRIVLHNPAINPYDLIEKSHKQFP